MLTPVNPFLRKCGTFFQTFLFFGFDQNGVERQRREKVQWENALQVGGGLLSQRANVGR